ncbi:hypothetical protein A0U90_11840 [Kozakia baliensis]|nr:hypothetical protein A0U90_11840 [Kozakia baliensis]
MTFLSKGVAVSLLGYSEACQLLVAAMHFPFVTRKRDCVLRIWANEQQSFYSMKRASFIKFSSVSYVLSSPLTETAWSQDTIIYNG